MVAVSSLDWQQAEVNPICIQYNVIVVLVYYGLQSMTVWWVAQTEAALKSNTRADSIGAVLRAVPFWGDKHKLFDQGPMSKGIFVLWRQECAAVMEKPAIFNVLMH